MAILYKASLSYLNGLFKGQLHISNIKLIGAISAQMGIYNNGGFIKNYLAGGSGKAFLLKGQQAMLFSYKQRGLQCYALAPMQGIRLAPSLQACNASFKPLLGLAAGCFIFKASGIGLNAISLRLCSGAMASLAPNSKAFYGQLAIKIRA